MWCLWDVFAQVGGISAGFTIIFAWFMSSYSLVNFKIDAINAFFNFKSKSSEYLNHDNKVSVNLCMKVRLITGCCVNPKLKRFMNKGVRVLSEEMDVLKMRLELR